MTAVRKWGATGKDYEKETKLVDGLLILLQIKPRGRGRRGYLLISR